MYEIMLKMSRYLPKVPRQTIGPFIVIRRTADPSESGVKSTVVEVKLNK